MKMRSFIRAASIAWLVLAAPAVFAQPAIAYRIGYLSPESPISGQPTFDAFRGGLRSLGYVEGRDVEIVARWGDGSDDLLDKYAAGLVQSKVDVVVAQTRAVFALRRVGATMPVVFAFSGDPVLAKLVESLARPGGNFTGLSMLSLDLTAKRMQLLKEIMPKLQRVAIVANPGHAGQQAELSVSRSAADALGLALEYFPVTNVVELEIALAQTAKLRCDAIMVFPDAGTMSYSERIAQFTARTRIPAMSGWVPFAERGNLVTYGPELRDAFRRLAAYVDKIRKGAKPADLPVELPTKFELAINLRTARVAGISIPPSVELRADRMIE